MGRGLRFNPPTHPPTTHLIERYTHPPIHAHSHPSTHPPAYLSTYSSLAHPPTHPPTHSKQTERKPSGCMGWRWVGRRRWLNAR